MSWPPFKMGRVISGSPLAAVDPEAAARIEHPEYPMPHAYSPDVISIEWALGEHEWYRLPADFVSESLAGPLDEAKREALAPYRIDPPPRPVSFTVWVDGAVADTEEVQFAPGSEDGAQVVDIAQRHAALAAEAEAKGSKYMVDVAFWDGEHVRWGTDVDGEVVPVEVGVTGLGEAIAKRFSEAKQSCDTVKMGYICQRKLPHYPDDLHAQLVRVLEDGQLRVALWRDGLQGVLVTKMAPAVAPIW